MFTVDSKYQIKQPISQFFSSQMITQEWVQPGSGEHVVFPVTSDIRDGAGHTLVTAYAVQRPGGELSLMLINKDQLNAHSIHIVFEDAKSKKENHFSGTVQMATFGSEQYQWHSNLNGGTADPDGPIAHSSISAGSADATFTLPKASVTVLRGTISSNPGH
jgi:hypothetical protein